MAHNRVYENDTSHTKCIVGVCAVILLITACCLLIQEIDWKNSTLRTKIMEKYVKEQFDNTETLSTNKTKRHERNSSRWFNISSSNNTFGKKYYYEEQMPVVVHDEAPVNFEDSDQAQTDAQISNMDYAYYDKSGEDYDPPENNGDNWVREESPSTIQEQWRGRAAFSQPYQAYHQPWTPVTPPSPSMSSPAGTNVDNRDKMQTMQYRSRERNPYPMYDYNVDDYDYPLPSSSYSGALQSKQPSQQAQQNPYNTLYKGQQMYGQPKYGTSTPLPEVDTTQSTLLTVVRGLKTAWDLFRAISRAWNAFAAQREKQMNLHADKLKANATHIVKKPTKYVERNSTIPTKKKRITTTELPPAKVEPRKQKKPQATDLAREKRYIKGDPLKGYYDFVITEGSYKFWAVFQVGTAILIIYSTFAAIYYSKVNPLVSDYDYTDYLGGARSLSGGDLDFVDDDGDPKEQTLIPTATWFNWVPRVGHSLQFILDAIDKLPADHNAQHATKSVQQAMNERSDQRWPMTQSQMRPTYRQDYEEEGASGDDLLEISNID